MAAQEPPPAGFSCPYQDACPHLGGLSTAWVQARHSLLIGSEGHYEQVIAQLNEELAQAKRLRRTDQQEIAQLKAQVRALHQRQFQGRKSSAAPPEPATASPKKRGAPKGHPPWTRPQPKQIDLFVDVPAPRQCPDCQGELTFSEEVRPHVQEDIVLEPRVVTTCFHHHPAYCPQCDRDILRPGPGELLGSYIGPAAKATALYLRYELNVSDRKISRFFLDFFGLKFVPASAYGFERQAVRRGQPLYADLLDKLRALPVAHADETTWPHDGQKYWVWYGGDKDLAVFLWDAHRSTEAAQKLFGDKFEGVLVADAFASYNGIEPKDRQSCLAHIKTKAKEIEQEIALLEGKAADPKARAFCQKIQGWVQEACQAHHGLARGPWRAKPARAAERKFRRHLQKICRKPLRHPKAESLRQRLLGPEQDLLLTCFRRANVPPTNNQAERSLRPVVIMRKVIQGTRSEKGLENHTVLRSLFETARRQGNRPQDFFFNLFTEETAQAQASLYRNPITKKQRRTNLRC